MVEEQSVVEKMTAAVMHGPGDIRIERVARPECPAGGFVLRVKAVGLCGSDIRNLTTDSRRGDYPFIYGHEVVGEVCEVAPQVDRYQLGQMIYVYPEAACLRCENCRSGHSEQCTSVEHYTDHPGGFAEYIAYDHLRVERGATFELPAGTDPVLATLAEPLSSTYACVENIDVHLGDTVVILGAGPVGIMLSVLSRLRGAARVILADTSSARLGLSEQFDIDERVDSSTVDPVEEVLRITGGVGADKVISANPSTAAQQQALAMARRAGVVVFFGGVAKGALTEIDTNLIHYRGLWIHGHYGANSMQVQRAFELSLSPRFPTRSILTHILPLSDINDAVRLTREGRALKVALIPEKGNNNE